MPTLDASSLDGLRAGVAGRSDDELLAAAGDHPGGPRGLMDELFATMVSSFDPSRNAGRAATVRYELTTPTETLPYRMHVTDGACTVEPDPGGEAEATIRAPIPVFLGLVTGHRNGLSAMLTGKLKVSGDLLLAQQVQGWFVGFGGNS